MSLCMMKVGVYELACFRQPHWQRLNLEGKQTCMIISDTVVFCMIQTGLQELGCYGNSHWHGGAWNGGTHG